MSERDRKHDPDPLHSSWKNPYVIYILLMLGLFGFLIVMGYIAWTQGWIPNRGTGAGV